jgi:septal ring factor EnvC (AmiA/AmiB activator)
MKVVIDFLLKHKRAVVIFLSALLVFSVLFKGIDRVGHYIKNKKIAALEQTIQASEVKIQQLEGQLQVTTAALNTTSRKLEESDARVADAESRTNQVRTVYVGVRSKGPTFVSKDTEGQVKELTDVVNGLYP